MSDKIIPFDFGDSLFRSHIDEAGVFWFVAKDVCAALGIEWKGSHTIGPLDEDERGSVILNTPGGRQEVLTVSESGLYHLIFKSRKPEAKKFRSWVTSEVLPALREQGCYSMPENNPVDSSPVLLSGLDNLPRLRSSQRTVALQSAVQMARMTNGTEADVERLFKKFSYMLSDPRRLGSEVVENCDFQLFKEWADKNLIQSEWQKKKGHRLVIQHTPLYQRYCNWAQEQGRESVSRIAFGRWMRNEMNFRYEKSAKGWYFVEWVGKNPLSSIPFNQINTVGNLN